MSNKASKIAESVASASTRRGFLGRLAKTAGTAAAAMAGVLATQSATAGRGGSKTCCVYQCFYPPLGGIFYERTCKGSPNCRRLKDCHLIDSYAVNDCSECG